MTPRLRAASRFALRVGVMSLLLGLRRNALLLLTSPFLVSPAVAETRWGNGQTVSVATYECPPNDPVLAIEGQLELVHPADRGGPKGIQEIYIRCDCVYFNEGSKVLVKANLYIRAETLITGHVNIENRRATAGVPGANSEAPASGFRQTDGGPGSAGAPGRNAMLDPRLEAAEDGQRGGEGLRGTDGLPGADGVRGGDGGAAGSITLKARSFAGAIMSLSAQGAPGGDGGVGGRGQDGGNGGHGGKGGDGGAGDVVHPPGNGGDGGRGGDGGDGGRGGQGGDGGNGGPGGDVRVLLIVDKSGVLGAAPEEVRWSLEGGGGGAPGVGGQGGNGGKGGLGGAPGCGGDMKAFSLVSSPGRCGEPGSQGESGRDGSSVGPTRWGRDGVPGAAGRWEMGYVKS